MRFIDACTYNPQRPWAAIDIAEIDDTTVRLHWTDQPYHWHVNDGTEVSSSCTEPSTCTTATTARTMLNGLRQAGSATPKRATNTHSE